MSKKGSDLATHYVARDPFARGEYARFAFSGERTCAWCGQKRKTLYVYIWQQDSLLGRVPRRSDACYAPQFCNLACFHSYM